MSKFRVVPALVLIGLAALLAACGGSDSGSSSAAADSTAASSAAADTCAKDQLALKNAGQLTIGTDKPAYPPYFEDDDPSNGKGFESAVAYAIAKQLAPVPSGAGMPSCGRLLKKKKKTNRKSCSRTTCWWSG